MQLGKIKIYIADRIEILRAALPYYLHPSRFFAERDRLIMERNAWRDEVMRRNEELYKDELVQNLFDELDARKRAADEAEIQNEKLIDEMISEIRRLKALQANFLNVIDDLSRGYDALAAALIARGGDPNAVRTQEASADC